MSPEPNTELTRLDPHMHHAHTRPTHPGEMPPTDAMATELALPVLSYDAGQDITIEAAQQMNGLKLWKVRDRIGNVLGKTGEWEWEPSPSNRDQEYLDRCRFATARLAWECLQREREAPAADGQHARPVTAS